MIGEVRKEVYSIKDESTESRSYYLELSMSWLALAALPHASDWWGSEAGAHALDFAFQEGASLGEE